MRNGYLSGVDAIDLARITGLQLYRTPCMIGDPPDTSWEVADQAIASGVDPEEYFMDMDRLSAEDAGSAILSLIGLQKAWHDYCTNKDHGAVSDSAG